MGKLSKQLRYVIDLDEQYRTSLINYTLDAFSDINAFLRKSSQDLGIFVHTLEDIDYTFENVPPLEESITVYRGMGHSKKDIVINRLATEAAFISTSTKEYIAADFADTRTVKCCIGVIIVVPGSKILPLSPISEFPEAEILLDRRGKLILTHETIHPENGITYLYLTYIPHNGRTWSGGI